MVDLFAEYKDMHYREIEFSDRLTAKIGTSITLLTIIGSGHVLLISSLFPIEIIFELKYIAFSIVYALAIVTFGKSLVAFYHAYSGFEYHYFPIERMGVAIDTTLAMGMQLDIPTEADKHIEKMFIEQFRQDATHNRAENMRKARNHKALSRWTIISFIWLAVTYCYFTIFVRIGGIL